MLEIKVENGKLLVEKNANGYYTCKYYEYYKSINDYRIISEDENCTKEYIEETFNISVQF